MNCKTILKDTKKVFRTGAVRTETGGLRRFVSYSLSFPQTLWFIYYMQNEFLHQGKDLCIWN